MTKMYSREDMEKAFQAGISRGLFGASVVRGILTMEGLNMFFPDFDGYISKTNSKMQLLSIKQIETLNKMFSFVAKVNDFA